MEGGVPVEVDVVAVVGGVARFVVVVDVAVAAVTVGIRDVILVWVGGRPN